MKVVKDIIATVDQVKLSYITGDEDIRQVASIAHRLKRHGGVITTNGVKEYNIVPFRAAIDEYNEILLRCLKSGETLKVIQKQHVLSNTLAEHIIDQVYDRIITADVVDQLKMYKNGTNYVYGEIKRPFASHLLCNDTQMSSEQVFVDLGSGVGNVVLQAALQIGCESWGCEFMDNPARLARAQYKEFKARCQLWGIQPGNVHLLHGDFTDSNNFPKLYNALKQADVVLTNNFKFTPDLNAQLVMVFLELKTGCQIISLEDFTAINRVGTNSIAANTLSSASHYKWESGWVSWAGGKGVYYIATRKSLE